MRSLPRGWRGPRPYPRLDLTGVRLPDLVLVGTEGRAAMLKTAREHGYRHRTVTPALTRFSRVYVIQLGGNPQAGTVVLATKDGREVVVKLPVDVRFRIVPVTRTETMLAAIAADYPSGTPTAALAEALSAVLHVCDRQYATGQSVIPVQVITEALATPLNALLRPWDDEADTAAAEPTAS
ncbi:hypothetical protein [Phytohabitans houttuyneae]|uniref:Uncharacterized protein n=1 Tax=Phytohabitans houttuyneae TaxID=1076126 RepID=A0A6V8KI30_9ACTN|nr:hypothetical protein [Phytohabitans houttuyneae]GFJ84852.1 hypothetical protein Phou_090320 [Phytohabitans houttuyneae]